MQFHWFDMRCLYKIILHRMWLKERKRKHRRKHQKNSKVRIIGGDFVKELNWMAVLYVKGRGAFRVLDKHGFPKL